MSTTRTRRAPLVGLLALVALLAALLPSTTAAAAQPTWWTSVRLTRLPSAVKANATVPFMVVVTAGGVPGLGAGGRAVLVERSTNNGPWASAATVTTNKAGFASGSFTAAASGAMRIRVTVPAAGAFKLGRTNPVHVGVISPPPANSIWTSVGLLPTPKEVPATAQVTFRVSVAAGGGSALGGQKARSVTVERSTDKASWSPAASLTTTATGVVTGTVSGLDKSGSLYLRATVAATGPFKAASTSAVYVKILPQYAPTAPKPEVVAPTGTPVSSTLFGVHPVQGNNPVAGAVRLWDTGTQWSVNEPSDDSYSWWQLDQKVEEATRNNQQILLVLGATPTWAAGARAGGGAAEFAGVGSTEPPEPADFADYVEAVVQRYGTKIAAYQVWNEANIPSYWAGTPDQMAELTKVAYDTIKRLQPSATVVAASTGSRWLTAFSDFFPAYLRALAARGWPVDAYAVHLYPKSDGTPKDRAYLFGMVKKALADTGAPNRPIWETEINYGVTNPGSDESARAIPTSDIPGYVGRTYLDSLRFGIERSYWYAWTPSYHLLGIQMYDGFVAATAYKAVAEWLVGSTFFGCTTAGVTVDCSFTRDGKPFHVYYTDDGSSAVVSPPAGATSVRYLVAPAQPVAGPVAVSGEPVLVS